MNSPIFSDFSCVQCGANALTRQLQSFGCVSCGADYPIVHDVPILFPDVIVESVDPASDHAELAVSICDYQGLPKDPKTLATVQNIFLKNYRFADRLLDAESQQYIDRIKATRVRDQPAAQAGEPHFEPDRSRAVLDRLKIRVKRLLRPMLSQPLKEYPQLAIGYEWVLDYLPRQMFAANGFTGNARLKNTGDIPISSQGPTPVMIAYHWYAGSGERCASVVEHRTPFPIDLQPGREITLPVLMDTPNQPGKYELELCLVQEHVCWHETDAIRIPIEIVTTAAIDQTPAWPIQAVEHYSYADDHHDAVDLLKTKLATLTQANLKVLEIGGNACPMLFYDFPGTLYNLDIDVHGLQVGYLAGQAMQRHVTFLCADAHAIPFPDAYFDCITIFSSLHHFPDLRVTLRALAQKINPQGFLAVMCEPVGHPYGEGFYPLFIEELLKGVNEQSFSLAEYAAIFQAAGLVVDEVIVHGGSLKAFLRKC
jgi:SAM-dependent methyltransferase